MGSSAMENTLQTNKELLSITDLMELSGESESAWRKRLSRRELPFIRLGSNVRIRRIDLELWLDRRTIPQRERL
jgi:predicted DNA-binding transcriptional regulator AlpA